MALNVVRVLEEMRRGVRNVIKQLLNITIDDLEQENATLKKALYIACSDYYSLHYPNGHRSIEDIYNDYIQAAKDDYEY